MPVYDQSPHAEAYFLFVFAASLLDWSLISLVNMLVFLAIQITDPKIGMFLAVLHVICFFIDSWLSVFQ